MYLTANVLTMGNKAQGIKNLNLNLNLAELDLVGLQIVNIGSNKYDDHITTVDPHLSSI